MIGQCDLCKKTKRLTRGYCASKCYIKLIRNGSLQKLPKLISPATLTQTQEETLIGLMLGDGCLFVHPKSHNQHPYLTITRKITDRKYLEDHFNIFKEFCNVPLKNSQNFDKRTKKTYHKCRLLTRPSSVFLPYYKNWYNKKKKHIPKNLKLTPLICAVWFCDDGCILNKKNRLGLKISTHGFSKKDNCKLQLMLQDILQEHFGVAQDAGNYFLIGADAAAKAFIKYIEPYIPDAMNRKVKWTTNHFKQKKSRSFLKNRNKLDISDKGKQILMAITNHGPISPKQISEIIGWKNKNNSSAPSGISLYLNRFLDYKWVNRSGTLYSCKNGIKYTITNEGQSIINTIRNETNKTPYMAHPNKNRLHGRPTSSDILS